jgi:hypothetical protein
MSAILSSNKLAAFNIERVICYHGGLYAGNATRRIAEIAHRAAADNQAK